MPANRRSNAGVTKALFRLSTRRAVTVESPMEGVLEFVRSGKCELVHPQALTGELRQQMTFSPYCDNMQHLEGFAQTLCGAIGDEPAK